MSRSLTLAAFVLAAFAGRATAVTPATPDPVTEPPPVAADTEEMFALQKVLPPLDAAVVQNMDAAFDGSRCGELAPLIDTALEEGGERLLPHLMGEICASVTATADAHVALLAQRERLQQPSGPYFGETLYRVQSPLDGVTTLAGENLTLVTAYYEVAGGGRRLYYVMRLRDPAGRERVLRLQMTDFVTRLLRVLRGDEPDLRPEAVEDRPGLILLTRMARYPAAGADILVGAATAARAAHWKTYFTNHGRGMLERAAKMPDEPYARYLFALLLLAENTGPDVAARSRALLDEASALGLADADAVLAAMDAAGFGAPRRRLESSPAWRRAATGLGAAQARYFIGTLLEDAGPLHDSKTAQHLIEAAAKAGDANAQLSWAARCGRTKQQAPVCMHEWLDKAARQGHAGAMAELGAEAFRATTPEAKAQGRAWYEKALAAGYETAATGLGVLYALGNGVPIDKHKARSYYEQSAAWGDAYGEYDLGKALLDPDYGPVDPALSTRWLFLAAGQGHVAATTAYAVNVETGAGIAADPKSAVSLYRFAVGKHDVRAMLRLATMAYEGRGMDADPVEAASLLKRAADAGNTEGMRRYGRALLDGQGVPADRAAGLHWLQRAADAGDVDAKKDLEAAPQTEGSATPTGQP